MRKTTKRKKKKYASGTKEHGVLSAAQAAGDPDLSTSVLDQVVRQEGGCHLRIQWTSVGEGCWRKGKGGS